MQVDIGMKMYTYVYILCIHISKGVSTVATATEFSPKVQPHISPPALDSWHHMQILLVISSCLPMTTTEYLNHK